ncbi:hypothetical protein NECAME_05781 [Necator americanus]|uniref:Secreted protein n=1 Tax=Necator americanus TaxID=51031 RepID=W2TXZ4_NECAM|nr:hypothetical protein NECAME_05781 [Necator americanus]ETN86935.1 hypothetical protein NECAME_05781 [Necator americanus]
MLELALLIMSFCFRVCCIQIYQFLQHFQKGSVYTNTRKCVLPSNSHDLYAFPVIVPDKEIRNTCSYRKLLAGFSDIKLFKKVTMITIP